MRIRKTVTKLLGSAMVYPSHADSWTPLHSSSLLAGSNASSGEICQLNQSPWDSSEINLELELVSSACQDLGSTTTKSKEESFEKKEAIEEAPKAISVKSEGILVNSTLKEENKNKTEPIQVCKRETQTQSSNIEENKKDNEDISQNKSSKNEGNKRDNDDISQNKSSKNDENKKDNSDISQNKTSNIEENKKDNGDIFQNETSNVEENNKKDNENTSQILCTKNDGRKWFCKRPAQLPHTFCAHHVVQCRNYYMAAHGPKPKKQKKDDRESDTNPKPKKQKRDDKERDINPKPKKLKKTQERAINPKPKKQKKNQEREKARERDSSNSSFFYYYEGFGPWRGKRRGERNAKREDDKELGERNGKKEVDKRGERKAKKDDDMADDVADLAVAGVVEDEDEEEVVGPSSKGINGEKKVGKKRGRKPIKCRSLKELM